MIALSAIEQKDVLDITQWPQYEGVHSQMDYAIRKNGWLDCFCSDSRNYCYAAKIGELCIGFSLLIEKEAMEAEFRIAVHPGFIGSGYGGKIVKQTLAIGFFEHKFKTIILIVRKNNVIAQRLYAQHGFTMCGETKENIQGRYVDFFIMKIDREHFMGEEIKINENPPPHLLGQLEEKIRSYNNLRLPEMTVKNIALSIQKENVLIGGLCARMPWDWLHIVLLWVAEQERKSGIGKLLIEKAENEAIEKGCKHAMLETFTVESKDFFTKQGYEIYAELPDFPIGFKRYYLKKQFS